MSKFFQIITVFFSLKAILFSYAATFGRRKYASFPITDGHSLPSVSVIIPARNEEQSLSKCLDSLLQCTDANFEAIIVNDRSSDATQTIIDTYQKKDSRVKSIHLQENRTGNLQGKPGALHFGIEHAQHEIIMMTDADCTFPHTWVSSIARRFTNPNIGLVASFTVINTSTMFHHLQNMEWLMNHTLAAAGMAIRQPLGCFGNNLSIRKSVYDAIGGYAGIPFSVTEDLTLLQTVYAKGWEIEYPCSSASVVTTEPCLTWKSFLDQQHRWVKGSEGLGMRKYAFVILAAMFWISLLLTVAFGYWQLFAGIIAIRLLGDCMLVIPTIILLKKIKFIPWVIPGMVFMIFMEMLVAVLLFRKDVHWKGQVFKSA